MGPRSHTMVCMTHIGLGDKEAESETLQSHGRNGSDAPLANVLNLAHD